MGISGNPAKRAARECARVSAGEMHATFYCDESGNTGVNWGDPHQPVFVHGGWMVPSAQQDALLAVLPGFRRRHGLNALELKWQQLARRKNGSAVFRDIFGIMFTNGAVPFFHVMDKDYLLAAKAVETFFDPEYNRFLPMVFTEAFDVKKELAERLLLAPDILSAFADMLRGRDKPEPERINELAFQFADFMEENNGPVLAEMLRHFDSESLAAIGYEFGSDVWMRTTLGHSMFALMNALEQFLRPRSVRIKIVHDNIVRFDDLLDLVRGMFRTSDVNDVLVVNGEIRFFSMPTVDSIELGDSKREPFIQLADLLVGFVRTVFTKLKQGEVLTPDERAVCGDLVMLHQEFCSWSVDVPLATLERFSSIGWADLKQRSAP